MGRFPGRFRERQRDDALGRLDAQRLNARGTRLIAEQPIEALLDKALLPAPNTGLGLSGSSHDPVRADALGGQQHDFSPPNVLLRGVAVLNDGSEPTGVGGRNGERFSSAHRADLHVQSAAGILSGLKCQVRSTSDGELGYVMKKGIFTRFCDAASLNKDKPFVLIIDEINRADLSSVFGELMYAIEYRNEEVSIPHFPRFSIPKNVYIIGTMNSTDKSLVVFDLALRRRFSFL